LGAFVLALLYPTLPSLESLTDYQPKIPLRIVSAEGHLLGEFGEERRSIVAIADVPELMKKAILAAEDERFYTHGGVDYLSVVRAAASNLASGTQQGAGTITMQVARNFFLTREKTVTRKLREVLLAWKIEANLSKDEILQLYVNQIFLGQRAYGFAAAAQIYFGKPLKDLSAAEAAMLAGLPKAPSAYNPVTNPRRAKTRQLYVLRRMHDLRFITDDQFREAQSAPLAVRQGLREVVPIHAEFVAEMARQVVFDAYGEEAYTRGLTVHTTIRKADQEAAYAALRRGALDYDRRHGYRGPEAFVGLPDDPSEREAALERVFQETPDSDGLVAAVVVAASPAEVKVVLGDGEAAAVTGDGLRFAAPALRDKSPAATRIRPGAVIRLAREDKGRWAIVQVPQVEGAFVSMRPVDGALLSLVGGFDFERNKFNHVTQAQRQPGSAFKPFIYSAALEKGFTPATVVNDAPFFVPGDKAGGEDWEPKNYDGKFEGPMRVRAALAKSKNLVTVRVLQAIGPQYAQDYVARFGFDPKLHPAYLTMGLGAGAATPLQMIGAYAVFANGGYRVAPYLIARIVDAKGNVLSEAAPAVAGDGAERAIDPRNAWLMTSLLKDVIRVGTAVRALSLGRTDLAGKTGTTNENVDAWFCGYNPALVAVAWIGFDQPRTLGTNETGAVAALPIWISYMAKVLKGTPVTETAPPDGVVAVKVNADTGLRDDSGGGLIEYFFSEFPPRGRDESLNPGGAPGKDIRDQLF
jgi:penicillin-binding protein 1A